MADPLIISLLSSKRAEVAGIIVDLECQIAGQRAALAHIDATMRLFDPNARPEAIVPKGRRHNSGYFAPGDVTGMCLASIREASGGTVSSREIAVRLMTSKQLDDKNTKLRHLIQTSVRNALMALKRRGVLESVGTGWDTRWRLTEPK